MKKAWCAIVTIKNYATKTLLTLLYHPTISVSSTSMASNARSTKIPKSFTIKESKTTRKEVTDPILGKSELIIGVIIYLFLLHCLYFAAPPYGKFSETLFFTLAAWLFLVA